MKLKLKVPTLHVHAHAAFFVIFLNWKKHFVHFNWNFERIQTLFFKANVMADLACLEIKMSEKRDAS